MKDSGVAIMGSAEAEGEDRATKCVENALNSPLLNDNNIENRPLLAGSLGKQPYWYKKYGINKLPNVDDIDTFGLYLPNNHEMSEEEIKKVCNVLNSIV